MDAPVLGLLETWRDGVSFTGELASACRILQVLSDFLNRQKLGKRTKTRRAFVLVGVPVDMHVRAWLLRFTFHQMSV